MPSVMLFPCKLYFLSSVLQNIVRIERVSNSLMIAQDGFYHIVSLRSGEKATLTAYDNYTPLICWMQQDEVVQLH